MQDVPSGPRPLPVSHWPHQPSVAQRGPATQCLWLSLGYSSLSFFCLALSSVPRDWAGAAAARMPTAGASTHMF